MESLSLLNLLVPVLAALSLSILALPHLIQFSIRMNWFDQPDARKVHVNPIPRTGGLALVPAVSLALVGACWAADLAMPWGLLGGLAVLYLTGLYDDLKGMAAMRKLMLQVVAAALLAADGWRLVDLGGLFGLGEFPLPLQYGLTILLVTAVINAYNLIDGIDGLAGGLAVFSGSLFMWVFWQAGDGLGLAMAAAMTGAYAGFLFFNFAPARIFMGDTGSMALGFLLAALSLRMLALPAGPQVAWQPWQALAILSTPLYDVLRVMLDRALRHGQLFRAERNHVHHLLLRNGFSHRLAVLLIVLSNGLAAGLAIFFPHLQWYLALPGLTVLFVLAIAIFRNLGWYRLRREEFNLLAERHALASDNPFFDRPLSFPVK